MKKLLVMLVLLSMVIFEAHAARTTTNESSSGDSVVAQKLQECDFLCNKKFKKNAKVYLCLFSAYWCPPCRAEMPRIAKMYKRTLKRNPDIELIHFSRDRDEHKAEAWAKEHDVKFPVVKSDIYNPLELNPRGIPHLFIIKADGTLLEEGHPKQLFTEEKLRKLKKIKMDSSSSNKKETSLEPAQKTTANNYSVLTGPYGIRMEVEPGCEKGAEYVLEKLRDVYLPLATNFYGNPFRDKRLSRTYTIKVKRNGVNGRPNPWPSFRPGTKGWEIYLPKNRDEFDTKLDYLASSILTVCPDAMWEGFAYYVNRLVKGTKNGEDPTPWIKDDIQRGLEGIDSAEYDSRFYRAYAPMWSALEELRAKHPTFILDYCTLKNREFAKGDLPYMSPKKMVDLLREVTREDVMKLFKKYNVIKATAERRR